MKLKSSKTVDVYPEYEGDGYFVEGAKTPAEAAQVLNNEYLYEEQDVYTADDAKLERVHKCLDCGMGWCHSGDYCCGECGEYRLSKKYKEVYYFENKYK